ncbi:hypothetical protein M8J77_020702 [Diaphorina citri]|nr:hypothetical protein M8J77_020702 [Diaphorina citri]
MPEDEKNTTATFADDTAFLTVGDHNFLQISKMDCKMRIKLNESKSTEMYDPFCLESSPRQLKFADITSAAYKIKDGIVLTPCMKSHLSELTKMEIFLKKDFFQVTGSFKERGACYALLMLSEDQKKKGVISASLGNHAQAMCYHGSRLNIPVTVVMPIVAPIMKIQACRRYGATVIVEGADMKEAKNIALKKGAELGLTYINGTSQLNMARDHHPGVWQIQKDVFSLLCQHHSAKAKATSTTTTFNIFFCDSRWKVSRIEVAGRRARGRPKKKWENCVNVNKDLSEKGLSVDDVHNRGNWKLLSKNADPT